MIAENERGALRPTHFIHWKKFVPAALFVSCAALLLLVSVVILSLDSPVTRRRDPRTRDAYIGGDVTTISARLQGYLVNLPISDNQHVHAGDLIAEIDDADYRARRDEAQASLEAARAQLAAIEAEQRVLASQIGQSRSTEEGARSGILRTSPELRRQRALIGTDVGIQAALDRAVAEQKDVASDVAAARAQLRRRELQAVTLAAQRRAAVAAVAAREQDVLLAKLDLGWTRIVAPIDGTLGARRVRVGDLIVPGTALVSITPLDRVWVDANFIERQLPFIQVGQRAVLRVDAYPGFRLEARVTGLSPTTGGRLSAVPPDNTTGNFTKVAARVPVRLSIDWHGSTLRGLLRPGMSAIVTVVTGREESEPADGGDS
jgi:membrane fusion protein, multidrug efflux system